MAEAETYFHQALAVARRQQAKSWELHVAIEQPRSRRTPIMVYASSHFEIFETLSVVYFVLQLLPSGQDWSRHWLVMNVSTQPYSENDLSATEVA
jgi:hypothetical protein